MAAKNSALRRSPYPQRKPKGRTSHEEKLYQKTHLHLAGRCDTLCETHPKGGSPHEKNDQIHIDIQRASLQVHQLICIG